MSRTPKAIFLVLDHIYLSSNISLSGDLICFKFSSFFPQVWFYRIKKKKEKNLKYFRLRDQKTKLTKKRKNAFLCLDQNICKTRSGNIKFGIKYPQHIHFPNVKENNFYMLTFCENNGSTKLAKKPNFLLHNENLRITFLG